MRKVIVLILLFLFVCGFVYKSVKSQSLCVPRMVTVVVGDNTPGNPQITLENELGCVYNVFTQVDGYLPINTAVIFSNARWFAPSGEIQKVSGEGIIIGYQITRLIHTEGIVYIIQFDGSNQMRLHPFEFETK